MKILVNELIENDRFLKAIITDEKLMIENHKNFCTTDELIKLKEQLSSENPQKLIFNYGKYACIFALKGLKLIELYDYEKEQVVTMQHHRVEILKLSDDESRVFSKFTCASSIWDGQDTTLVLSHPKQQ